MVNSAMVVITGWMVNELKLKGNELFAYAIIYGFSQDGNSCFRGSLRYIHESMGCSKSTAVEALNSLIKKGLIKKEISDEEHHGTVCYRAVVE